MSLLNSLPYFLITVLFSLLGQTLMKMGVMDALSGKKPSGLEFVRQHLASVFLSPFVIAGIVLSGIGVISYMYLLSSYEIGRALPILGAVAYLGMFFIGRLFLHEQTTWQNLAGILLIVGGLYLVSLKPA